MYLFPPQYKSKVSPAMGAYLLHGPGRHGRRARRMMGQDDTTGDLTNLPLPNESVDMSNLPLAPSSSVTEEPLSPLAQPYDTGMIAVGTPLAPAGQNYNAALANSFNPTPAQAAQMAVNSLAPLVTPTAAPVASSATGTINTGTILLIGAAIFAVAVIGGGSKGRR